MKRHDETLETVADEVRAYDVLEMLMRLHGVQVTLDVLRYWYVVSSLNGKRKTAARPNGRKA